MQLLITPLAAFDLEEICDYIAQDNPVRAGSFVAELRAHCEKICLNPAGYRRRPELSDDLRSCAHGNYVIFFIRVERSFSSSPRMRRRKNRCHHRGMGQ
jgi:toxin ParE1/3/4